MERMKSLSRESINLLFPQDPVIIILQNLNELSILARLELFIKRNGILL